MTSRTVRVLLVLLAIAATIGLAYRAVQDEIAFSRANERIREVERAADTGLTRAADLRAALYAYVAAGQGHDFWIGHAGALLEGLAASVSELNEATYLAGVNLDVSAAQYVRTIQAAEVRARRYVKDDQTRLASDVIFTETRDALDNLRLQMTAARDETAATGRASHLMLERQRAIFAAGGLLVWLIAAALLVPIGRAHLPAGREASSIAPATPTASTKSGPKREPQSSVTRPNESTAAHRLTPEPARPLPAAAKGPDVAAAAALCGDFARAASAQELEALLGRAAGVLDATGLIVWLANSTALYPAASWGYEALLSRVSSIPRDSVNLTAAAFRTGSIRTSSAGGGAPAAVAAPLVGPGGPVGVLAGEIRGAGAVGDTTRAVAAIFAAQLVTLVGSMPSTGTTTPAQQANA